MKRALAIAVILGGAGAAHAQSERESLPGHKTFIDKCAPCHGDEGGGDGPAAQTMLPRPRVFAANGNYKFRSTGTGELPLDKDLYRVITEGIPGTAMPAFDHLDEGTRNDLVAYIKTFNPDFVDPEAMTDRIELPVGDPPDVDDELIAQGKQVYEKLKCQECHGVEGRGDGPGWDAKTDKWKQCGGKECPIVPANLTRWHHMRNGADLEDLFRTTLTGLNGTPMPASDIPEDERWALAAYLRSIQQPRKDTQDQVVLAKRLDELPTTIADERWAKLPQAIFPLVGQVVQKPRLFWPSVTEVFVRAAYNDQELVLLIEWDDRDQSKGTNLTEPAPEKDPIGDVLVKTDHPDQMMVQFPARYGGKEKPFFLLGDSKRAVNLWWWSSHRPGFWERNATGAGTATDQALFDQELEGEIQYENGRYRMLLLRKLQTRNKDYDVQFAVGRFLPIAFNVWQGSQGEVGQRRGVSTWYLIVLDPPVGKEAYAWPFVAGGLALAFMLLLVVRFRRGARDQGIALEGRDQTWQNAFRAVTTLAVGAAVFFAAGPRLQRNLASQIGTEAGAEGIDEDVRALEEHHQQQLTEVRPTGEKTVAVPIDQAMALVVEGAAKDPTALVPAIGTHDQPTHLVEPGPPKADLTREFTGPPLEVGRMVFMLKGPCAQCHSNDGKPLTAPTFKGLFGKTEKLADGTTVVVDEAYIRQSIREPNAKLVEGFQPAMPVIPLTEGEVEGVIAYLKTLK